LGEVPHFQGLVGRQLQLVPLQVFRRHPVRIENGNIEQQVVDALVEKDL